MAADVALVVRASVRARFDAFTVPTGRIALHVTRTNGLSAAATPITGADKTLGAFELLGDRLKVEVSDDPEASLAALRLGWHLLTSRQGGVLMHAAAVAFGNVALIASGMSGSGKTTLTRYLLASGGTLLSDEIVAIFPDGSVRGTPFRSDLDLPGTPRRFQTAAVLLLDKGDHERIGPVSPHELMQTAMSQVFTPPGGGLNRADALERVTRAFSNARTGRLTFRKDPAAGVFVRDWLNAPRG